MTTTFSIRFKKCLKEKNIKQAELARSTKITPSSIGLKANTHLKEINYKL